MSINRDVEPLNMSDLNKTNSLNRCPDTMTKTSHLRMKNISKLLFIVLITLLLVLLAIVITTSTLATYYKQAYVDCQTKEKLTSTAMNCTSDNGKCAHGDLLSKRVDASTPNPIKDVRLPLSVVPKFYDLSLQVHIHGDKPESFYFNGSVTIKFHCSQSVNEFFVHSHNDLNVSLNMIDIHRLDEHGIVLTKIDIRNITYETNPEWYRVTLINNLVFNASYQIKFGQFRSLLNKDLKGWYLSHYKEKGKSKYVATSQLQPTDARRVFPCWDEPAFKSQFQVSLIRNKDFHSLSNMALQSSTKLHDDWYMDKFQPSVNMSTYLLAFVVSQFESIHDTDSMKRNFTVWARPEKINAARYALKTGQTIISFFEDYFKIPYPLNKTDMVAVPDFAAGAMENWGLMIYREATMLWDPETGTAATRQKVATVISHEVAHQWFGNLVTLQWWDDLWLNEGFASFVEYIGVDHVHSEWAMDEQFLLDDIQKVLISDSLPTSRPVIQPVYYPNEINEIFDPISYNKGASILRMVQSFLGRQTFRAALNNYLHEYKFRNTVHEDLWRSLTEASNKAGNSVDVKSVMDTWMKQMNYPLVIVKRTGSNTFEFMQQHYLDSPISEAQTIHSPYNFTWIIPLTYTSENTTDTEGNEVIWMHNKTLNKTLNISPQMWYLFNIRQAGFYRVHYADGNWDSLTKQLHNNHKAIPLHSRTQILDDLFNLANRGTVSYTTYLNLTQYLKKEDEYVAWETARRAITYMDRMLIMDSSYGGFQAYLRTLVDNRLNCIDWTITREDKNHTSHLLRLSLTRLACHVEHYKCVNMAKQMFHDWMLNKTQNNIPPSLRPTVYCTAVKTGGQKEWNFLYEKFKSNSPKDEDGNILPALACTKDMWILKLYLEYLIQNNGGDSQELPDAITYIALNPIGQIMLWNHLKEVWKRMAYNESKIKQPINKASLIHVIIKILSKRHYTMNNVHNEKEIIELQSITHRNGTQKIENHLLRRNLNELLKRTKENVRWTKMHRNTIAAWLEKHISDKTLYLEYKTGSSSYCL